MKFSPYSTPIPIVLRGMFHQSVNANSRPSPLAQGSRTRGVQDGCHGPSVSEEQSTKVSGQLRHSSRRRRLSTSKISQPAPFDRSAVST